MQVRRADGVTFSFAGQMLPMSLRVCRALLWTQAAFILLGGVFVLLTAAVFGRSSSIQFHGGLVSGGGAALLGALYVSAGLVLAGLAAALARLTGWSLPAIVVVEVILACLDLVRSLDASVSTVVHLSLAVAVVLLLLTPDARHALARGPAP